MGSAIGGTAQAIASVEKQSQADQTQQNISDQTNKLAYQQNLISQENAQNTANVAASQTASNEYATKNQIAANAPEKFGGQAALEGFLQNLTGSSGPAAGSYKGFGAAGNAALSEAQQQAITNLANAPTNSPIPAASSVVAPVQQNQPILGAPGNTGDQSGAGAGASSYTPGNTNTPIVPNTAVPRQ